jgi:hypothetical protein
MRLERVRFWQGFSAALALVLIGIAGSSAYSVRAQAPQRQRFAEIDVERINIVEADGTTKLVIANRNRAPDQVSDGQSRPRTDANKSPGITFFDDAGDEAGGLKIRGDRRTGPTARRHLLFDQHRGDQAIGLISEEAATERWAALQVWDRPDRPLVEVVGVRSLLRQFRSDARLCRQDTRTRGDTEVVGCTRSGARATRRDGARRRPSRIPRRARQGDRDLSTEAVITPHTASWLFHRSR